MTRSLKRQVAGVVTVVVVAGLSGCVAVNYPDPISTPVVRGKGVYHPVAKGETLWSISQEYGVDIEQLIAANGIVNAGAIKQGQRIFIPGADQVVKTEPVRKEFTADGFDWPIRGRILTYFGSGQAGHWSQGVRIQCASGEPVLAVRRGEVVFADDLTGYGPTIMIDHKEGLLSVYANNADLSVALGDQVSQGDAIGVTRGGRDAFVYFEIRRDGNAANPLFYLPKL
ncbi:MAG TPA: peptidoglycan DD-metalloendopeptidase family protein [Candidatus Bathyarchaeia archaeon]|nr:peptidoglycan DD-metalloendopeptidase family protein [Candidatus Bathyarchaeia archaeon]